MKNYVFMVIFLLISSSIYLQDNTFKPPDYKKIKNEILNKDSKFYYPTLFERYAKNDSTLVEEEYHYLYFGYTFNKNYDPYFSHDSLQNFLKLFNKENLSENDYGNLLNLGNKILAEYPFDLRIMTLMAYLYNEHGNKEMARKIGKKNAYVIGAIMNSGDGRTVSTAFYVICIADEYQLIKMFHLKFGDQALGHYKGQAIDLMSVENEDNKKDVMHFNVTRLFQIENQMLQLNK